MTPDPPRTLLLLGLAAPLACTGAAPGPVPEGPNVLLVSIDTLRADHLSFYGYERPTSPRLDAFAEQAVVFENAQASASWTLPGMASVFTSTYTTTHGCWGYGSRLDDSFQTLAEELVAAGWDTACVVSHLFCTTRHGLQQGFVNFDDSYAYPAVDPEQATTSHVISDHGIAFIEAKAAVDDDRPWFLWLHYFDPHADYVEQPGFTEHFMRDDATPIERTIDLYDGEIAYTDHHVGRVLDALRETALEARTIVVLVADHGEEFLDHGGTGHGATLFAEQLHVPFVVRAPGFTPRRAPELVRTVDLLPTVLALAGLPIPDQAVGRSLVPALRGEMLDELPALAETRMSARAELEAVLSGNRKLVRTLDGAGRLYEAGDETRDLSAEDPESAARLETLLDRLLLEAAAHATAFESASVALPPTAAEQLHGLGYTGEEER